MACSLSKSIFNGVIICYIIIHCDKQLKFIDLFCTCICFFVHTDTCRNPFPLLNCQKIEEDKYLAHLRGLFATK